MIPIISGCTYVAGNYPQLPGNTAPVTARCSGPGFQLLAGSRLPLDQAEAELAQLKSQGFSRRDSQIIKSLARRKNIPPALLADRSGCAYYRITARLDAGTNLTLVPGSLEVTLDTRGGFLVVRDQGYLLEDRRAPGGCRPPAQAALALGASEIGNPASEDFLVRLPVGGEIVRLALVPDFNGFVRGLPSP